MVNDKSESELRLMDHKGKVEIDQRMAQSELFESNRRLKKEVEKLRETQKNSEQLSLMSAELLDNLRSVEVRLYNIQHTATWKLGQLACSFIRKLRSSGIGKTYYLLESIVKFRLKSYLGVRRQMRIVEHAGLFDSAYYVKNYPLIGSSIWTPLEHYILHGEREGRQPNSAFRPYYYNQQVKNAGNKWGSPLVHYIKEGADNNLDPSPFFSTSLYKKKFSSGVENPLRHYLNNIDGAEGTFVREAREIMEPRESADDSHGVLPDRLQCEVTDLIEEVAAKSVDQKLTHLKFTKRREPEVSILIPFFNKLEYSVDCLYALQKQECDNFEVIMIDDASDSEDCEALTTIEGIELIRNKTNLGYLKSCNLAASRARGKYIVQLNNDTLPLQGWLENLLKTFKIHPNTGLAGSLMLDSEARIQEAGGVIFSDASGYNYGRENNPGEYRFNYCREVDYCSGASIMIRRDVWESLGGYDALYEPAYYEDTDFAMKIRKKGLKVLYNPFSKIVHHEGVTSGTDTDRGIKKYQKINQEKFLQKWQLSLVDRPNPLQPEDLDQYVRTAHKRGSILWIDAATPTPDKDSGSIDTVNFFDKAISDGWAVTFLPWSEVRHDGVYTDSLRYKGVECIDGPSTDPGNCLRELNQSFDLVVISRLTVAKYAYPMVRSLFPDAKIIFNTVDLHFLRYQRESDLFHIKPEKGVKMHDVESEKNEELELVRQCEATIVVSQTEAEMLHDLAPGSNVSVIPLFREVVGRRRAWNERINIGFIGGYQHPPNVDAVKYFVREIWPTIKQQCANVKFIIAGSNVPGEISRLASKDIEVRGYVSDLTEFFEEVRIMVAPLRYGAGIKGKIVSGLCHGVPQVVTCEAAEGMGLTHEENTMIANNVERFADQVVRLYNDPVQWESISENAIIHASRNYSKQAVAGEISKLLNRLLEAR